MSQEIVERLLRHERNCVNADFAGAMREAASLITTLRAERDEARDYASSSTTAKLEAGNNALIAKLVAAEALVQSMREAVEQAFRDGIAYASMVKVTDVDLAWEQSRARAALSRSEV